MQDQGEQLKEASKRQQHRKEKETLQEEVKPKIKKEKEWKKERTVKTTKTATIKRKNETNICNRVHLHFVFVLYVFIHTKSERKKNN